LLAYNIQMPCNSDCVPAFCVALSSNFRERTTRDALCKIADYVAYVRLLVEEDIANGLQTPSAKTQAAAQKLIADLDDLLGLYKGVAGAAGHNGNSGGAANAAQNWGLKITANCRLVTILIKNCYASANDGTNYQLAYLANGGANYVREDDRTWLEFLCCLCEHFQTITNFLSAYVNAC